MTNQRRIILEELKKAKTHPTADEIFQSVRRRLPSISLGTVYRNLEIMSESGMIMKLEVSGTVKRFDATTSDHYHVRCKECGRIDDVDLEPFRLIDQAVKGITDYEILSHRLEFIGVCPSCQKKRREAERDSADLLDGGDTQEIDGNGGAGP